MATSLQSEKPGAAEDLAEHWDTVEREGLRENKRCFGTTERRSARDLTEIKESCRAKL